MTREEWRWQFAGQIFAGLSNDFTWSEGRPIAIEQAEALIAALEATAPKEPECNHAWGFDGKITRCLKCGVTT